MLDFMKISTRSTKRGVIEIYPKFIIKNTTDLMIRGGDFYAIWDEEKKLWTTSELDAVRLIDNELDLYFKDNAQHFDSEGRILYLRESENGMMDKWLKYCQKHMRDSYHMLDEKVIFANAETTKSDYASKKMDYSLEKGDTPSWDRLLSVLYSEKERHKIEWAIGSIVTGDSRTLQKFFVFHGEGGKGKGTILQIIQGMFRPYCTTFPSKELGSNNGTFAFEAFRNNPLVAIDFDSKLNKIEDNTRLNSLVAHEPVVVNEKFKSTYTNAFKCILFIGTNNPVKITDAKSGLIRRLIDISPTGDTLPKKEYDRVIKQVAFEYGAIASKCRDIYLEDPGYYDKYVATSMLSATNDFYNYILSYYDDFVATNETTATQAYAKYLQYCEDARVPSPMSRMYFKEELKNYFKEYKARSNVGSRPRDVYIGFRTDRFEQMQGEDVPEQESWLKLDKIPSLLDKEYADCKAQYVNDEGHPRNKWANVKTTLKDLDTSELHYILVPDIHHIFIDFDIKDETGQKSFKLNYEAASKFTPTYAEVSKSGVAIHLHYIYAGDPNQLEALYAPGIEVKVMTGNSALRRRLTLCNDIPMATISSGLPLRKEAKVVNNDIMMTERGLRTFIKKCLNKTYPPYSTSCNVDYIYKKLEEMHESGVVYNVQDMHPAILTFAMKSSHQADRCVKLVSQMKFKSDVDTENLKEAEGKLVFYDVEVFPNLFLVCWKVQGAKETVKMFNPTPTDIENLIKYKLVGFNCRRYDNHILYARMMGYTNKQLFNLSQRIVNGESNCFFSEAYNLSYTDVFDFSSVKQSLKKFEIELKAYHDELGFSWDEDVPEDMWDRVAEYCCHDVEATELVFESRQADWLARQILADVAGMTVNDTTNSLSTRIIFGKERHPQREFNYRNLAGDDETPKTYPLGEDDEYTVFQNGKPIFPGYVYESGKSVYRGVVVGEGGRVYAEPGIYHNVALLDIASMHPSSTIAEWLFGKYTATFQELRDARVAIKHGDFDKAKRMLGGKLAKYLTDEGSAKDLAQALKIVINSVYGLTSAAFDNPFRDIRNVDNIVAKRGALFMVNLQHEVQARGFTVAHIKTDSIKIPDATPEIIQFVMDYGKLYGYDFEHEATYEKMCLVNDAVYIAKYPNGKWTATGTQFQIPYVFKTLFSHEPIEFSDLCETKSVSTALYLDLNENLPDVSDLEKEFDRLAKEVKNGSDQADILEARMAELIPRINDGHTYQFVGKVGLFTPIKPGFGGGELLREVKTPKSQLKKDFASATGAKGYRWLQSNHVEALGLTDAIDISYYEKLANEARKTISAFGDFDDFVS